MHTHEGPFYGCMDSELEETFTHSHLSWSSIIPYLLHPSTIIHGIFPVQSTHLTIFFHNLSLVYLLAQHPPHHTPYISSPNHGLLFTTHAHTIATCFTIVLRLCHLILVSLSTLYLKFCLVVSRWLIILNTKYHLATLSRVLRS